jgi:hypothetical protein
MLNCYPAASEFERSAICQKLSRLVLVYHRGGLAFAAAIAVNNHQIRRRSPPAVFLCRGLRFGPTKMIHDNHP